VVKPSLVSPLPERDIIKSFRLELVLINKIITTFNFDGNNRKQKKQAILIQLRRLFWTIAQLKNNGALPTNRNSHAGKYSNRSEEFPSSNSNINHWSCLLVNEWEGGVWRYWGTIWKTAEWPFSIGLESVLNVKRFAMESEAKKPRQRSNSAKSYLQSRHYA
jgi:G3E family GTPase